MDGLSLVHEPGVPHGGASDRTKRCGVLSEVTRRFCEFYRKAYQLELNAQDNQFTNQ